MELASLIADGRVAMIGAIRQELLYRDQGTARISIDCRKPARLPDTEVRQMTTRKPRRSSTMPRKGIQGSNTDFLICAVAARNEFAIFTTDTISRISPKFCRSIYVRKVGNPV